MAAHPVQRSTPADLDASFSALSDATRGKCSARSSRAAPRRRACRMRLDEPPGIEPASEGSAPGRADHRGRCRERRTSPLYRVHPGAFQPVQEWLSQAEDLWRRQPARLQELRRDRSPNPAGQVLMDDTARVSVSVSVPPQAAFEIFTHDIDRWWRRRSQVPPRRPAQRFSFRLEPHVGGRLFESIRRRGGPLVFEVGRVQKSGIRLICLEFSWRNSNSPPTSPPPSKCASRRPPKAPWSASPIETGPRYAPITPPARLGGRRFQPHDRPLVG